MNAGSVVGLIDYGAGNLRSVEFALEALDVPFQRVVGADDGLEEVDRLILPGVGAAGSAMAGLEARGLVEPLRRWDGPLLGICLGMQLLAEVSEEGEREVRCLGLVPGRVRRIRASGPLPHMGWNRLSEPRGDLLRGVADGTPVYFLHSLRVDTDGERVSAWTAYGERFAAALETGALAGVQFHPEKSGSAGLRILANFAAVPDPAERVERALREREDPA